MPDLTIDQFYTTQYDANWQHLVQQSQGRLHSLVRHETVKGKRKFLNFMGKTKARLITTRNGKTIPSNTPLAKRKLSLRQFDDVYHEDEWDADLLGEITSPRSAVVVNQAMAFQRAMDETIIGAATGDAWIGEDGTEAVAVPTSQKVAVSVGGANSGLNLAKIVAARSILGKNEAWGQNQPGAMGDKAYFVVSQVQLDNLLTVDQITNSRYADVKALVRGEVNEFLGFTFIRSELLPFEGATDVRICFAFMSSGIAFASNSFGTKMTIRDDLNETLQVRTKAQFGATRTEEEKVVLVYCDESGS